MKHQAPRGTQDMLPSDAHAWQFVEAVFEKTANAFGYGEIRTPMFEDIELFLRTSGESSDIATKEMYDFLDKGGRHVALKPEGTAPAVRAFLEHSLGAQGLPVRLWYGSAHFRYGRPQKGRLRQLHQFGLELIGTASPEADAEVITATDRFLRSIGLVGHRFSVNNIGRSACRERYGNALLEHLSAWLKDQPEESRSKAHKNPLRLIDSKDESVQTALEGRPKLDSFVEDESKAHFAQVCEVLGEFDVTFNVDPSIVRGLDYYTDTVFELMSDHLGAQSSLCGGGRYDGLVEQLGGPSTPAVGVGIGIERCLLVMDAIGKEVPEARLEVFVVCATPGARVACRRLAQQLRDKGRSAQHDLDGRSLKAQFKVADRLRARKAMVIGEDELARGTVSVKDMETGEQTTISWEAACDA